MMWVHGQKQTYHSGNTRTCSCTSGDKLSGISILDLAAAGFKKFRVLRRNEGTPVWGDFVGVGCDDELATSSFAKPSALLAAGVSSREILCQTLANRDMDANYITWDQLVSSSTASDNVYMANTKHCNNSLTSFLCI